MSLSHTGTVLVTGVAGFIGYHLVARLLDEGCRIAGVDNLTPYYDIRLKQARLDRLLGHREFAFHRLDLADRAGTAGLFAALRPAAVVHLAAQAGVRHSLEHPHAYLDANLAGFLNVLEGCRRQSVAHLVYASSSSVYGANTKMPFAVHDSADHPLSLYAATKRANELMAHSYSHLYGLPVTGLRFFTVYGPWGRPDMAIFLFAEAMRRGRPVRVFNYGRMWRDFTYVDDIVEGLTRIIDKVPEPDPAWSGERPQTAASRAPYRLYNIGNNQPVELRHVIATLERQLGVEAIKEMLPMQPGDVPATCADVDDLERDIGFRPATPIEEGIARFVRWYKDEWIPLSGETAESAGKPAAAGEAGGHRWSPRAR